MGVTVERREVVWSIGRMLCVALWSFCFGPQIEAEGTTPVEHGLGEPIPLEKGLVLTVTREPFVGGSVEADARQRTLDRGVELRLNFENKGTERVEDIVLLAAAKADESHLVLIQPKGKKRGPEALQHAGSKLGYRTVYTPGGIMIRDCVDNAPVGLATSGGKHIGVGSLFCSKPGEKDEILVMFRTKDVEPGSRLLLQGCSVCPKQGILVRTDAATPAK